MCLQNCVAESAAADGASHTLYRRKALGLTVLAAASLLCIEFGSAYGAPYCLLRKHSYPFPPNCFEFHLADTANTSAYLMASAGGGVCAATAFAARQGWETDPTVPGPHATWSAGDKAMAVVSPYFDDAYGCHGMGGAPAGGGGGPAAGGAGGGGAGTGGTCETAQLINQPESRDNTGRITVEAATIHVLNCPAAAGGMVQLYVYEYLNRAGFRVIQPPAWGSAIGGHDFETLDEAAEAATNFGRASGRGAAGIRVTSATYGASCGQPAGNVTKYVSSACDGRDSCEYAVHWEEIGDPANGCKKDFSVEWACSSGAGGSASAPAEAGYGSKVILKCSGR